MYHKEVNSNASNVKYFCDTYEVIKAGAQSSVSCGETCNFSDHGARQFIAHLHVSTQAWRGLLMRLGAVPTNFHHHNDILNAVAYICASGKIQFYKIPRCEKFVAIPCGKDIGIRFIKVPRAHGNSMFKPLPINNLKEVTQIIRNN